MGIQDNHLVRKALEAAGVIPKDGWNLVGPFLMWMQQIHDHLAIHKWAEALDTMEQELFPETLKDTQ